MKDLFVVFLAAFILGSVSVGIGFLVFRAGFIAGCSLHLHRRSAEDARSALAKAKGGE